MLKVGIVTPFLKGTGGTETVVHQTALGLASIGDKVTVFVLGGTERKNWLRDTHHRIFPLYLPLIFKKFEYCLRLPIMVCQVLKANEDCLLVTNPIIWAIASILRTLFRKKMKIFAWYHYSILQKPVANFLLKKADFFIAISSGIKNQLIQKGVSAKKIGVTYNPATIAKKSILPKSTNKSLDVIFIGRYDYSGQKNLSELFLALKKSGRTFHLRVYGAGEDTDKLKSLATSLGIDKEISWLGFKDNLWDVVRSAQVLILTSKFEGFPMVLIESLAHGVPVISSNCSTGPDDIVQPGVNGWLYEVGDVKMLAKLINDFDVQAFDQKTLQSSVEKFSTQNFILRMQKFLKLSEE